MAKSIQRNLIEEVINIHTFDFASKVRFIKGIIIMNDRIFKKLNKRAKEILIEKIDFVDEYSFDCLNNIVIEFESDIGQPDFVQPSFDYLHGEVMYALSKIEYNAEYDHCIEVFKHRIRNPHDVFKYAKLYL